MRATNRSSPKAPVIGDVKQSIAWSDGGLEDDSAYTPNHMQDESFHSIALRQRRWRKLPGSLSGSTSLLTNSQISSAQDAAASAQGQKITPIERKAQLMVRYIASHNKDSKSEPKTPFNLGDECMTPHARKKLFRLAKNKDTPPTAIQNLKKLMLERLNRNRGTKVFYSENMNEYNVDEAITGRKRQKVEEMVDSIEQKELEEEFFWKQDELHAELSDKFQRHSKTSGQCKESSTKPYQRATPFTRHRSGRSFMSMPVGDSRFFQNIVVENAWKSWQKQKASVGLKLQNTVNWNRLMLNAIGLGSERINELLAHPGYNPRSPTKDDCKSGTSSEGSEKPNYYPTRTFPDGIHDCVHVETGVFVFTPAAATFLDFGNFLKMVEEIGGREAGVVKVVVPEACVSPYGPGPRKPIMSTNMEHSNSRINEIQMPTLKVKLSLNEETAQPLYGMFAMQAAPHTPSLFKQVIQQRQSYIVEKRGLSAGHRDVWKNYQASKPYNESKMIRHAAQEDRDLYCVSGQPATAEVRAALGCGDPNLKDYFGCRFIHSTSSQKGINESVFHLSGSCGSMFAMQLGKFASYSLNYHHTGSPRCYTVVKPECHEQLEKFVLANQENAHLQPPSCSQFIRHQPVYVPNSTLAFNDIKFSNVTQYKGEMVIIFPYAYHQGFNAGANITEGIMYASNRWEGFHRRNLYEHCNRNCAGKEPDPFNLDFVHQGKIPLRGGYRGRWAPSSIVSLKQESIVTTADSATLYAKADTPCSRKRRKSIDVSGLKAMDRVSDDGEWQLPDNDDAMADPSNPRCPKKQKVDFWSVDSVYPEANNEDRKNNISSGHPPFQSVANLPSEIADHHGHFTSTLRSFRRRKDPST